MGLKEKFLGGLGLIPDKDVEQCANEWLRDANEGETRIADIYSETARLRKVLKRYTNGTHLESSKVVTRAKGGTLVVQDEGIFLMDRE
jgi:hypothetical protein